MRRFLIALGYSLGQARPCQTRTAFPSVRKADIDGKSKSPIEKVLIVYEGDQIVSVVAGEIAPAGWTC